MKNEIGSNNNKIISTAIVGCIIVAVILTIGTLALGNIAERDTQSAVHNVSNLYLSELAGRREQVVSAILNDYIHDLDTALGMIDKDDLSSIEKLKIYQLRMKQLYELDKFAFIDSEGLIYTSRGTRSDIDQYHFDHMNITEPVITIKNLHSNEKKVVIAVPADNLQIEGRTLVVCFMEIDMDTMLRNVSLQSNNSTTFCNIYTRSGVALTNMVLGGLASENNLLSAMKNAKYDQSYSYEKLEQDFASGVGGVVSFNYNDISETLYYVPVRGTDWMLTYLIRESVIGEQINSISHSIIVRSLAQSILTAIVLVGMFVLIFMQQRRTAAAELEMEVAETENRLKQQELEEQLALQEELSDALRAAEAANRAKSGFVSNMSHEIRTPITAILGMNEMILRESTDENILSYAENINTAGMSLLGIISDILDFSKIEAGRIELVEDDYSLRGLLNDLYNLMQFRAEAKGIQLRIEADADLPQCLRGDVLRVKQIIANLLSNGVKYTDKGSVTLKVTCEERDPEHVRVKIAVAVVDTGIGIKNEEMEKLFTPFDRLDFSRNRSIEGTGLGLSISKQLLEVMDSELHVSSEYGKGSRFFFSLWQGVSDDTALGEYEPQSKCSATAHDRRNSDIFIAPGKRILVVDDMPMNIQVITGLLKRTQMIIDSANNGNECIEKFGKAEYDLVLMDYRMPGMDGVETLHKLHELYPDKASRVPIVALTASAILGDREKLLAEGFTDYLSKPVNITNMENVIRKYVESDGSEVPENAVEVDSISDDPDDVLERVREIRGLDCDRGLEYCGDAEDYLFALQTFSESVEEKAFRLEETLHDGKIEDLIFLVHSLKSMSKSIGAIGLSERAKDLEQIARSGNIDGVREEVPKFVKVYRSLGEDILSHAGPYLDRF